jgi:probable HAF family extracellular repeat protein
MNSRFVTNFAAVTLLVAMVFPAVLARQFNQGHNNQSHYIITDLGTLGGTFSAANGLNSRGSVAGASLLSSNTVVRAFLWHKRLLTDLGTLGGPDSNVAEGPMLNVIGEVVGFSDTSAADPNGEDFCGFGTNLVCLSFVWEKGAIAPLPTLGGNNAVASGVNNRGEIVGQSETSTSNDPCSPFFLQVEAVIWQNGQIQELPPLSGDSDGDAGGINDRGEVVGFSGCAATGMIHALLWRNGTPTDLGNLGGASGNFPSAINNQSQVIGESDLSGSMLHHAFLWQNGVMEDLGSLPGLPTSSAIGINNQGQIVGFSQDAASDDSSSVAVLWQNGVITDLNSLIPADSPWFLMEALGINDRGEIAGFMSNTSTGEIHGFLATPCNGNQAGARDCEELAESTIAVSDAGRERHKIGLPENPPRLRGRLKLWSRIPAP